MRPLNILDDQLQGPLSVYLLQKHKTSDSVIKFSHHLISQEIEASSGRSTFPVPNPASGFQM